MNWFSKSNPLAERARSPFYGSFIITWLIWNWRIVLTVLLLQKEDFGHFNIVQYIAIKYINIYDCIWIPLMISICFILILPWIDYFIVWYTEINRRKKIEKQLEIGKKYSVSGIQHNELWEKYELERTKLSKIENELRSANNNYEKELLNGKSFIDQVILLKKEKDELMSNHKYADELLANLQARGNATFFNGRWTHTTVVEAPRNAVAPPNPVEQQVEINGNQYFTRAGTRMRKESDILLMNFDPDAKKISFVKYGENDKIVMVELDIINPDFLEGYENRNTFVSYKRTIKLDVKN